MNPGEYDRLAELEAHYWWFVARRRLALALLDRSIPQARRILDIGCGTGAVLDELKQRGVEAVGLDASDLALAYCAQRGLPSLLIGDGTKLPLASDSMDAEVGLDVFEHIEDDGAALREAFRVLRPGGVLVLSVPAFKWLWGPHDIALHHFRRYRRTEVRRVLTEAGFTVERCSYSVTLLFPLVVLSRLLEKLRRGEPHASLPRVPGAVNRALIRLQAFEAAMVTRFDLPYGSSVVAVARKPGHTSQ